MAACVIFVLVALPLGVHFALHPTDFFGRIARSTRFRGDQQ